MADIGTSNRFTFKIHGLSAHTWVARFEASEGISTLFEVDLTLTSEDKDISLSDVIGQVALLTLETEGSEPRYIHGIVSRFRHAEDGRKLSVYHATLVPKLWRLRHRHDSRIFQAKKVPEILQEVLKGGGVGSTRVALTRSYNPREYCVQYRESDFAFVSRLMEEEGIYYFFEHSDSDHVLVLADAASAPSPITGPDTIAYRGTLGAMAHGESVSRFSSVEEVRPGKVTLSDFNFKKPSLSLLESSAAKRDPDLEVYDYPGEYDGPGDGAGYAKVRLEEWQARRILADGESGCVRMTPGYLFTLRDHPRDADNRKYLITVLRHRGAQPQMGEAAAGDEGLSYKNAFQAIPSDVPFRPERVTPRPTIKGVQTAIVTGPGGEEVHVDEHGRVKVHFHWDRRGKSDDTSSCWIRVSQIWAGAGWGAMWIPRIGHEVVVDFLEGDPDRPIIVGRVYHGANVPPYSLPAEKTKSTIKSNSSKGGGGSNELRFEDKKGHEEIWLHGQKDWNIKIEHDKGQIVGHDETLEVDHDRDKTVKHDQSETIGHDKKIDVGHDHTESIGNNESLTIGKDKTVSVGGDHSETVGGNQTISVGAKLDLTVDASMSVAVGAGLTETITGSSAESVSKSKALSVDENYTITVSKDMALTVTKNLKEEVQEERSMIIGKKLTVQCGDATVTIEKNGNITVEGKKIVVKGEGPIQIKGKKLEVKSEGTVNVEASGNVKIKGSNVGVN